MFSASFCGIFLLFTQTTEPSSPPANVEAFPTSSSSIQVVWDEIPAIHRNGIIIHYEIEYSQSGDIENNTKLVGGDEQVLNLSMLEDFETYRIRVRAYTSVGPGPYSHAIEVAEEQQRMKILMLTPT